MNLFFAISSLGDFSTLYMGELVMNELEFDWTVFVVSFSLLLGISILLVQKYVKEYPIEYEATASLSEFARDKLENVQLILHHSKRAAVVVQNFFIIGFYYRRPAAGCHAHAHGTCTGTGAR